LREKRLGVPLWVWGLGVVILLLLFVTWRRRGSSSSSSSVSETDAYGNAGYPAPIFIVPQAATPAVTVIPGPTPPGTPQTPPATPPGGGSTPPTTPTTPVPTPPGSYVTFVKFQGSPPPWNSTVWGIWNRTRTVGSWQQLWNHPMNNQLRTLRSIPEHVQPGDRLFVPGWSG
jgi:hypothetical protein